MRTGISLSLIAPDRLTEVLDEERKDTAAEFLETSEYFFVECGITVKRMLANIGNGYCSPDCPKSPSTQGSRKRIRLYREVE
ncbi:hypothetical protein MSTE_03790 [Mycobacteroides stephanolepidis]|uniref:Uncharacterized protein n=1 Tax=[Mycobacterium] stephanolepidis TaxID=1520670 RepID=A0A1Z4F1K4_9MYCO|nr:hypothetical protein [[Mycobacterium] stephanolepidis]BAX99088.1 hypothetical protein MSTE_03790 [[Mycobacterium] stephanolepidis]